MCYSFMLVSYLILTVFVSAGRYVKHSIFKFDSLHFTSQASSFLPVTSTGWTTGALVAAALVAVVTILGALWMQWKA